MCLGKRFRTVLYFRVTGGTRARRRSGPPWAHRLGKIGSSPRSRCAGDERFSSCSSAGHGSGDSGSGCVGFHGALAPGGRRRACHRDDERHHRSCGIARPLVPPGVRRRSRRLRGGWRNAANLQAGAGRWLQDRRIRHLRRHHPDREATQGLQSPGARLAPGNLHVEQHHRPDLDRREQRRELAGHRTIAGSQRGLRPDCLGPPQPDRVP